MALEQRALARPSRRTVLSLVVALASAAGAAEHCYFPTAEGTRLSYLSTTGPNGEYKLHWEVYRQSSVPLPEGGERVAYNVRALRGGEAAGWQRQERFVLNERGVYAVGAVAEAYGPEPVLVTQAQLETPDALWHFAGERQLPVAFRLLGLMPTSDRAAYTEAHYHVLGVEPVQTSAARFEQAVAVTVVGRVRLNLPHGLEWLITRGRQWYVPGIGLVKERLELADVPALGGLETELTSYAGVQPVRRETLARLLAEQNRGGQA